MHPIQLFFGFFSNILALGLIAGNIYFIREWYNNRNSPIDDRYAMWCLIISISLMIFITLGKFIFKLFLGKKGADEPDMNRSKETTYLQRDGNKIFLEFYGPNDAQPVIFIHGWSSNSTQWYYLKKFLSTKYRLILMDLPGCGNSSKRKDNLYAPEVFAQDLDAVITSIGGNKKPIVMGHSIGGMTILSYCKLYKDQLDSKLSGLVLVQTTYTNPAKTSMMSGLLTAIEKPVLKPLCYIMIGIAPVLQLMNWMKFFNGSMHFSNHLTGYAGTETKGQLNLTSYLSTISPVGVMARGMIGMFKYDATSTLSTIKLPVLILAGNKDILCKPEASKYMAQRIINSRLVVLDPSGHMGPLERNEQMIKAVDSFVKQTSPDAVSFGQPTSPKLVKFE